MVAGQRPYEGPPADRRVDQADVADLGSAGIAEEADVVRRRTVDGQASDAVTEAVEHTGERHAFCADRQKARAAVPTRGGARVDIAAQGVVEATVHVVLQPLQCRC